jgi:hypothetical protein
MYFFMYSLFLALYVSPATCTHPQEHNCSVTAIGVCVCVYGFGMLVHWSRYWLGHPHTFSTVNFGLVWSTLLPPDDGQLATPKHAEI